MKLIPISYPTDSMQVLPYALDLEKAVLGAIMIEKDAFDKVSEILTEDDFYSIYPHSRLLQ